MKHQAEVSTQDRVESKSYKSDIVAAICIWRELNGPPIQVEHRGIVYEKERADLGVWPQPHKILIKSTKALQDLVGRSSEAAC